MHWLGRQLLNDFRLLLLLGACVVGDIDNGRIDLSPWAVPFADQILATAMQVDGAFITLAVQLATGDGTDCVAPWATFDRVR